MAELLGSSHYFNQDLAHTLDSFVSFLELNNLKILFFNLDLYYRPSMESLHSRCHRHHLQHHLNRHLPLKKVKILIKKFFN
jgi:hypothetical protein